MKISNTTWDIKTQYITHDRDMTTGIQLKTLFEIINVIHDKYYTAYYPAGKGLFNLSKVTTQAIPPLL